MHKDQGRGSSSVVGPATLCSPHKLSMILADPENFVILGFPLQHVLDLPPRGLAGRS